MARPRKNQPRLPLPGGVFAPGGLRRDIERARAILGVHYPPDGVDRRLSDLEKGGPEGVTAGEVGAMLQAEHFGAVPFGAVSGLLDSVERLQRAVGLVAWINPDKARLAYLRWLADRLKRDRVLQSRAQLPQSLAQLPPEVRAVVEYYRIQPLVEHMRTELRGEYDATAPDLPHLTKRALAISPEIAARLSTEQLKRLGAKEGSREGIAETLALAFASCPVTASTFRKKFIDAKFPGWPDVAERGPSPPGTDSSHSPSRSRHQLSRRADTPRRRA